MQGGCATNTLSLSIESCVIKLPVREGEKGSEGGLDTDVDTDPVGVVVEDVDEDLLEEYRVVILPRALMAFPVFCEIRKSCESLHVQ